MARCECSVCRYHVFHVGLEEGGCVRVWTHSTADCQELAKWERETGRRVATVPIRHYRHGITDAELAQLYWRYVPQQ